MRVMAAGVGACMMIWSWRWLWLVGGRESRGGGIGLGDGRMGGEEEFASDLEGGTLGVMGAREARLERRADEEGISIDGPKACLRAFGPE